MNAALDPGSSESLAVSTGWASGSDNATAACTRQLSTLTTPASV